MRLWFLSWISLSSIFRDSTIVRYARSTSAAARPDSPAAVRAGLVLLPLLTAVPFMRGESFVFLAADARSDVRADARSRCFTRSVKHHIIPACEGGGSDRPNRAGAARRTRNSCEHRDGSAAPMGRDCPRESDGDDLAEDRHRRARDARADLRSQEHT